MHAAQHGPAEVDVDRGGHPGDERVVVRRESIAGPRLHRRQERVRGALVERIVVALHAGAAERAHARQRLGRLGSEIDDVAQADDDVGAEAPGVVQHRIERDEVAVQIRNEGDAQGCSNQRMPVESVTGFVPTPTVPSGSRTVTVTSTRLPSIVMMSSCPSSWKRRPKSLQ